MKRLSAFTKKKPKTGARLSYLKAKAQWADAKEETSLFLKGAHLDELPLQFEEFEEEDLFVGGNKEFKESKFFSPIKWQDEAQELVKQAQEWAEEQKKIALIKKLEEKWANKEYKWQQVLSFLKAKYGLKGFEDLTRQEWESKKLSQERMKALGLKSPKLSKALVAKEVPQKEVSLILGANYEKKNSVENKKTSVSYSELDCLDQGNSVFYRSCQGTDPRAAWQGDFQYNKINQETPFVGKTWFLWVVGKPMCEDGKGFEARAKLRLMYQNKDLAGLYVDRPYGQFQLLLDSMEELQEWWTDWLKNQGEPTNLPIYMPPVWQRDEGANDDFQSKYGTSPCLDGWIIPSGEYGYQDTLTHGEGPYDFMSKVSEQTSLLVKAYQSRVKISGVYYSSLTEVEYNPQSDKLKAPEFKLPQWRGFISEEYREFSKFVHLFFDADKAQEVNDRFFFWKEDFKVSFYKNSQGTITLKDAETNFAIAYYRNNSWDVIQDCPQLGFYKSWELPYIPSNQKEWTMVVSWDLPYQEVDGETYGGFFKAVPITHIKRVNPTRFYGEEIKSEWASTTRYEWFKSKALIVLSDDHQKEGFHTSVPLPLEESNSVQKVKLPYKPEMLEALGWAEAEKNDTFYPIKDKKKKIIGFSVLVNREEYGFSRAEKIDSWGRITRIGTFVEVSGGGFAPAIAIN